MPFVKTPNLKVHYEMAGGSDTTLLLLHGNFGSWRWWRPILEQLPEGYRAYAPDMRGCGSTERPGFGHNIEVLAADVHAFATSLDLHPVHLVGHSLGGAVALQAALYYPKLVRSLTLVAPPPAEGQSVVDKADFFLHWVSRLFDVDRDTLVVTLGATYRLLHHLGANRALLRNALKRLTPTLSYDDGFNALVRDAARMAPEAVVGHLRTLDEWNVEAVLGHLNIPTLVLGGAQDVLIAPEALERFTREIPKGRLVLWQNVGHSAQLEQPERFIDLLVGFIEHASASWWKKCARWLQQRSLGTNEWSTGSVRRTDRRIWQPPFLAQLLSRQGWRVRSTVGLAQQRHHGEHRLPRLCRHRDDARDTG
ncbi:MAG: alpha/beta fold hydrolase [Acidiferrobacterales bacterium]